MYRRKSSFRNFSAHGSFKDIVYGEETSEVYKSVYQIDKNEEIYRVRSESDQLKSFSKRSRVFKSVERDIDRLRTFTWSEDIQPSSSTIERAEKLWSYIYKDISKLGIRNPDIGPADNNSIDFFWGDKSERLLVNVPCDVDENLFAHFINDSGITSIEFDDDHYFNIINLVKRLRRYLD